MERRSLRLLIAEDSENDVVLLVEALRTAGLEIEFEVVASESAFAEGLAKGGWNAVLSDFRMPGFSALRALEMLQESGEDLPFIIVSGTIGDEVAAGAMRSGAHDYVMKNNLARLGPAVVREVGEAAARRRHRVTEEAYRTLVESSLQGLVVLQDDAMVFANASASKLVGYTVENISELGAGHWSLVHPEDRKELRRNAEIILAEGGNFRGECRLLHASGELRWVEIFASRTTVGSRPALQVALADINERKLREREHQVVDRLNRAVRGSRTREGFVRALLTSLAETVPASAVAIVAAPNNGDPYVFEDAVGSWGGSLVGVREPPDGGLNARVAAGGKALFAAVADLEDQGPSEIGSPEVRSLGILPLQLEDDVVGLLWIGSSTDFDESDRRVLTAAAAMASGALNRVTMQDELSRRLQRLHALRSIDLAINTSRNLDLVFDVMLEEISNELEVEAVRVYKCPSGTQDIELAASRGRGSGEGGFGRIDSIREAVSRAARERKMVTTEVAGGSEVGSDAAAEVAGEDRIETLICLPLLAGSELRGVLEIHSNEHVALGAEESGFLETVAWQAAIAIDGAMLLDELQRSNVELAAAYESTLEGWARALELRDHETQGHTKRVADLTVRLAARFGIDGEDLTNVRRGAILHDIGKMAIPDHILLKPGPLDEDEWEVMRRHAEYAVRIISPIEHLRSALDIPACHHERWNGEGYPEGMNGETIPLAARIFAVVDVWDALCSDRPYRKAVPVDEVYAYIGEQSGTQFDPRVVEEFLAMIDEDRKAS